MLKLLLRKLATLLPTLLGVTLAAFALIRLMPGDPVEIMVGERRLDEAARTALMAQLGLDQPLHPYTQALLSAAPALQAQGRGQRVPLRGEMPSPLAPPAGCAFHTRCLLAMARCRGEAQALREVGGRRVACLRVGG